MSIENLKHLSTIPGFVYYKAEAPKVAEYFVSTTLFFRVKINYAAQPSSTTKKNISYNSFLCKQDAELCGLIIRDILELWGLKKCNDSYRNALSMNAEELKNFVLHIKAEKVVRMKSKTNVNARGARDTNSCNVDSSDCDISRAIQVDLVDGNSCNVDRSDCDISRAIQVDLVDGNSCNVDRSDWMDLPQVHAISDTRKYLIEQLSSVRRCLHNNLNKIDQSCYLRGERDILHQELQQVIDSQISSSRLLIDTNGLGKLILRDVVDSYNHNAGGNIVCSMGNKTNYVAYVNCERVGSDAEAFCKISQQLSSKATMRKHYLRAINDLEIKFRACRLTGKPAVIVLEGFHHNVSKQKRQTLVYTLLDLMHKREFLFMVLLCVLFWTYFAVVTSFLFADDRCHASS